MGCSAMMKRLHTQQQGFSLIELAIVLVIIGVLLGSFVGTFTQRLENSRIAETQDHLEEIKTALIGYAYRNGHLPCTDCFGLLPLACPGAGNTPRDGLEDRAAGGACTNATVGMLPWVTLGLTGGDAWANRYRYWVQGTYSDDIAVPPFTLASVAGAGLINERDPADAITPLANNIVAVVISHGRNGYAGISTDAIARQAIPGANIDEDENVNIDTVFVSRPPSDVTATTAGGEFDDILIWLPEFELKAKMVEAGVLP